MKTLVTVFLEPGNRWYWIAIVFICMVFTSRGQVEKSSLSTEIYKLDNGLTVYLNEDHSLPSVFGSVAVRGGSMRDPSDATGIAHYFEHIMFKGTDSIGTLNYPAEKVYLDSIATLYDKLAGITDKKKKEQVQLKINDLSIKASQYAIPNELGKILSEMGGTMVNAGTTNEAIVYYNIFPSNEIEKWLRLYSHRFIHPVYRLFQSELETVYEEYNMYKDDRFSNAFEVFLHSFYPDYPYGIPVIGYPEDLKNPSMKKMDEYFQAYYVANNMALVVSGNFNTDDIKPLIKKYFGVWRTGEIPPMPAKDTIMPFHGRNVVQKKLTPVKFGIRGYRSVPVGDKDEPAIDVMNAILSNPSQTGSLDELRINHQLLQAGIGSMHFTKAGGELVIFVPKVLGQSLKKAESLVDEKLNDLKSGKFSDDLLEAVKTEIVVNNERKFENQFNRGYMMIMAFVDGMDWKDVVAYPEEVKAITRDDVIRSANKYYGDDYLVFYSKTGFHKKPETLKPPFKPIPAVNADKKSEYAKSIEAMPTLDLEPDFIEFGPPGTDSNEVTIMDISPKVHLFHVQNKVNNLFNLMIRFGIGTYDMPVLEQVSDYMGLIGTDEMSLRELSAALQKLGASYSFYSGRENLALYITGPDENFNQILGLVMKVLYSPSGDESKLKNLYDAAMANEKLEKDDPETLGYALYNYAIYGEKSEFINRLTTAEVKELSSEELLKALANAIRYEADIHYSGNIPIDKVADVLKADLKLDDIVMEGKWPLKEEYKVYDGPVIFFLEDKKAIQSKDYFFLPGDVVTEGQRPYMNAYAEYIDGGMQSILFQEIREFRSFAYAVGAYISRPFYDDEKTSLTAFVGTQADKTQEAVETMYTILNTPPDKSDRMDMVRKSLIQSINSNKPGFRTISYGVARLYKKHYTEDPRKKYVEVYKTMNFDGMVDFYKQQYFSKPMVITIIGDEKKIGRDWMKKYGRVVKVKREDIFRW